MKHYLKKVIVYAVVLTIVVGLSATVHAEQVTFSDVPAAYWGYSTIMRMTETGMFKGTSEPVNGVGVFMPERTMTRAEFITAVLRAVYPDATKTIQNSQGQWWRGYYNLALTCGLLNSGELDNGAMDLPMSRQEMAMVLVRGMSIKGEAPLKLVSAQQIADYATIGSYYKDYVVKCFSMGLICGIDSIGTFAPEKSLTRAEAATVLCRLVFVNDRVPVTFLDSGVSGGDASSEGGFLQPDKTEEPSKPSKPSSGSSSGSSSSGGNLGGGSNNGNSSGSSSSNSNPNTNTNPEVPKDPEEAEEEDFDLWDYSWEEYAALSEDEKALFENDEDFEEWLAQIGKTPELDEEHVPWDKNDPASFTLTEYEKLSPNEKNLFEEAFGSQEAFLGWLNAQIGDEEPDIEDDDHFGGRDLEDFTFDDYFELDMNEQAMFREQFFGGDEQALEDWLFSQLEMPEI